MILPDYPYGRTSTEDDAEERVAYVMKDALINAQPEYLHALVRELRRAADRAHFVREELLALHERANRMRA